MSLTIRILNFIASSPDAHVKTISSEVTTTPNSLSVYLSKFKATGLIENSGHGKYIITEAGKKYLTSLLKDGNSSEEVFKKIAEQNLTKKEENKSQFMSDDEKKEWLNDHFVYEIEMLMFPSKIGILPPLLNNAMLESFLIHARCLFEFFYDEENPKYTADARATHFVNNWKELRPKTVNIEMIKKRTGRELAHLTYDRKSDNDTAKQWNVLQIYTQLISIINLFLKKIPEKFLGKKTNELKFKVYAETIKPNQNYSF